MALRPSPGHSRLPSGALLLRAIAKKQRIAAMRSPRKPAVLFLVVLLALGLFQARARGGGEPSHPGRGRRARTGLASSLRGGRLHDLDPRAAGREVGGHRLRGARSGFRGGPRHERADLRCGLDHGAGGCGQGGRHRHPRGHGGHESHFPDRAREGERVSRLDPQAPAFGGEDDLPRPNGGDLRHVRGGQEAADRAGEERSAADHL